MQIFDWPWMVAVSVVAAMAMAWLVSASFRRRIRRVSRLGTRQLVMRLVPPTTLRMPGGRAGRLSLAVLFSAIALAGPRWGEEATVLRGEGIDIVLALDASLSMLATDDRPTRLERLKQEVRRLRAASRGDRFALLAFAGRSYILSPLTVDDGALDLFLDNLDPSIVGQAGSAISRAIMQGTDLLQASRSAGDRALVVMSDGEAFEETQEILTAADRAGKAGIAVVTVGFGTEEGSTIPIRDGDRIVEKRDENNQIVVTKYHPETLRAAAAAAQGTFISATESDKATRIRRALQSLRATTRQVQGGRTGTPRYQLFLIPALLLVLADTFGSARKRRTVTGASKPAQAAAAGLVMLVHGCALPGAQARRAAEQFTGGQYARSASSYRSVIADGDQRPEMLYNLGTALVAADSLDRSLEPLERATLAERDELRYRALFNLGLAQLKIGRASARNADSTRRALATAVELYKRALLMRPADLDAKWNYELAVNELSQQSSGGQSERQSDPDPQPEPREPPPSLGREQAEQLLSSAAREEQAVQGRKQREARPTTPRRGKDW